MQSSLSRSLLLFCLACIGNAVAHATSVDNVRIWSESDNTRVVLDLGSKVDYRVFPLRAPDRLVIDISRANLTMEPGDLGLAAGVVRGIRVARRDTTGVRVVLDLAAPVRPKTLFAGPVDGRGERLVVDLNNPPVTRTSATSGSANKAAPRDVIIAIDPGHGGVDPGAIGPNKTFEKDVVLAIGKRLAALIDAKPGMRALMIRDNDKKIPYEVRMETARASNADLFISIHADAFIDRRARGSSVYALSLTGATSEAARRLAKDHNESALVGGVTLSDKDPEIRWLLMQLSQNATISASVKAGKAVLAELATIGKVHKPRVQQANFAVLKSPDVPSILVETAFISNPSEERRLRNSEHQQKLAQAVLRGVDRYFSANPPPGTHYAVGTRVAAQAAPVKHVITRGDTLSEVAERYNVRLTALRRANALSTDTVRIGQVLTIPGQ